MYRFLVACAFATDRLLTFGSGSDCNNSITTATAYRTTCIHTLSLSSTDNTVLFYLLFFF